MNERIIELAKKSHLDEWFWLDPKLGSIDYLAEKEAIESFAELIIKECIQIAGPEDSYTDEWFRAKVDSINKIKSHFGFGD